MKKILHYIDGKLLPPLSERFLNNIEPATGKVYSEVADGDSRDVVEAARSAQAAFPAWSHTPAAERCRVLLKIADLLEGRLEEFARAESIDNGKPLSVARTLDIPRAVANLRFFATAILHARSESHATDYTAVNYTLRRPRGVVGLITPWNLPLYLFTWKVAPAIAVGNTAVAKPSEITPMTAYMFAQLCMEAGLPRGVLNIVQGTGAKVGACIVTRPEITTISFTGGTLTGGKIARVAGPKFKKVALEMGGKNPTIVFADADLETTLPQVVRAAFANSGQVCLCGSRILVERPIYDAFVEQFTVAARKLRIGDPLDEATELGPLVSKAQLEKSTSYVELARQEGGTIACGGQQPGGLPERCRDGYYFEPTVITGLGMNCRVNREEIFGPVAAILPFDSEEDGIAQANAVEYGLSASVWTRDASRAARVAERIEAGTVWVNCWLLRDLRVPFGGMKQSGVGREGGEEALRFFTEPKNVCIKY